MENIDANNPSAVTAVSPQFDWPRTRAYCKSAGLPFDEAFARDGAAFAREYGLDPDTADAAGIVYARRVWQLFNPQSYSLRQRLGMAWHFLFGRMRGG